MSSNNIENAVTKIWTRLKDTFKYKLKTSPLIRSTRALTKRIATAERADADEADAQHYDKPEVSTNSWDASKQVMELRIEADEQLAVISQCLSNVRKAGQYKLKGNELQSFLEFFKKPLGFEASTTSDKLEISDEVVESNELKKLEKALRKRYQKWQRVQEIIRRVKIRVFVCHAIFRISEKSRLELGSLILGGLVVLGAVHMYFFFQAAAGQVVHTYWTLDDIVIQGITTAWVAVGVLILYECALQLLLRRYEYADKKNDKKQGVDKHGHEAYRSNLLKAALRHPNVVLCSFVIVLLIGSSGLGYIRGSEAFNDFIEAARPPNGENTELELAIMVGGKSLSDVHLVGTTSRTAVFLQKVPIEQEATEEDEQQVPEEDKDYFIAPPSYMAISGEVGGAFVDVIIPDVFQDIVQGFTVDIYNYFVTIFQMISNITPDNEANGVTRVDVPYQVVVVDRQQVLCHTKGRACESLTDSQETDNEEEELDDTTEVIEWIPADYYFARFPIIFNRARLDESLAAEQDEEVSQVPFVDGVEYVANDNGNIIERLVQSLAPCTDPESNSPVTLLVEGYSSSAPFTYRDNVPLSESVSRTLNVRVANERRRNIEEELQEEISRQSVRGIVLEFGDNYNNLEQMKYSREFNDRPDEGELPNGEFFQDLFTRAAHIKLMELGRCSVF